MANFISNLLPDCEQGRKRGNELLYKLDIITGICYDVDHNHRYRWSRNVNGLIHCHMGDEDKIYSLIVVEPTLDWDYINSQKSTYFDLNYFHYGYDAATLDIPASIVGYHGVFTKESLKHHFARKPYCYYKRNSAHRPPEQETGFSNYFFEIEVKKQEFIENVKQAISLGRYRMHVCTFDVSSYMRQYCGVVKL